MALTKLNFSGSGQGALAASSMPSGSIIQTQYTQIDTASQITGISPNTQTTLTGVTVNITPFFTNSIIKLQSTVYLEYNQNYWTANNMFYFLRNGTAMKPDPVGNRRVGVATVIDAYTDANASSTLEVIDCTYFDSAHNTTSQITYNLAFDTYYPTTGTGTLYINRTVTDADGNTHERAISFIMAQEIKA